MKTKHPILLEVFAAVGSMSELARQLNVTRAAVNQWRSVPFRHLAAISKITGISRQKLRPDIYE